ncbi:MAG: hypothetical protein ACRC2T_04065, partial [Thermoguttaceae bacterium]
MKNLKLTSLTFEASPIKFVDAVSDATNLEASGDSSPPRFSLIAYTGGKIQTKNLPIPFVIELTGISIPNQRIPVRFEHKSYQGVGHTMQIAVIGTEVIAEGLISRDTSWARDVTKSSKNGFPWQASMGGPIVEAEYVPEGEQVTINGQTFTGEMYVVRKMTLKEISFVDLAADENTSAKVEAQYDDKEIDMTVTNTATKDTPTSNVIDTPLSGGNREHTPVIPERIEAAGNSVVDTAKIMREIQQNMLIDQRRIAAIAKIGGGQLPDLEAKAIEEGWSVERFHGEYQNKTMPDATKVSMSGTTQNKGAMKPTVLEAIALSTSGSSRTYMEAQYDVSTLE